MSTSPPGPKPTPITINHQAHGLHPVGFCFPCPPLAPNAIAAAATDKRAFCSSISFSPSPSLTPWFQLAPALAPTLAGNFHHDKKLQTPVPQCPGATIWPGLAVRDTPNHRQALPPLRFAPPDERQLHFEHLLIEKQQCMQRLRLRADRGALPRPSASGRAILALADLLVAEPPRWDRITTGVLGHASLTRLSGLAAEHSG